MFEGGDAAFERRVVDDCGGRGQCCDLIAQCLQFAGDVLLDATLRAKSGDDAGILQAAKA
ncbi:hypothetical protein D9M72_475490 [compost metagenome]